ncbi:hypothetical protein WR25_13470 [Diploscapter pachys]|uniref:Uncharacterized protein n=1 Tax=Diploscapter pachys TaxID=2018661 RepID=A0A2A2KGE6_9BILA|nr:hypothetical protein WR25_13470 [Diploscapter pachys]
MLVVCLLFSLEHEEWPLGLGRAPALVRDPDPARPLADRHPQSRIDHGADPAVVLGATGQIRGGKMKQLPRQRDPSPHGSQGTTDVVPPPPRVILSSSKERVRIAEAAKARFEELASGLFLPSEDRSNLIKELSFVNSSLALVPSIDDPLRATLYEKGVSVNMKLSDLTRLHETLLIGLNLRELIEKLGSDGQGSPLDSGVYGYLDVFARLNGAAIKDLIRLEREAVLRARGVNPYRAMPSLGRLPLDGSSFVHRSTNTVIPNLFGEVLRSELTTADSSASRALERLRRTDSGRANRNNSRPSARRKQCDLLDS